MCCLFVCVWVFVLCLLVACAFCVLCVGVLVCLCVCFCACVVFVCLCGCVLVFVLFCACVCVSACFVLFVLHDCMFCMSYHYYQAKADLPTVLRDGPDANTKPPKPLISGLFGALVLWSQRCFCAAFRPSVAGSGSPTLVGVGGGGPLCGCAHVRLCMLISFPNHILLTITLHAFRPP